MLLSTIKIRVLNTVTAGEDRFSLDCFGNVDSAANTWRN